MMRTVILAAFLFLGSAAQELGTAHAATDWDRRFSIALSSTVDGGYYNAATLSRVRQDLIRKGVDPDDAGDMIMTFVKKGIRESMLQEFASTAAKAGYVHNVSPRMAAFYICQAFTSNMDAVRYLDEKWNFLTLEQYRHIRSVFDDGHAELAHYEAFEALASRLAGVDLHS